MCPTAGRNFTKYWGTKYRNAAWGYLDRARTVKAQALARGAYEQEKNRVLFFVEMARSSMHISLIYRRIPQ